MAAAGLLTALQVAGAAGQAKKGSGGGSGAPSPLGSPSELLTGGATAAVGLSQLIQGRRQEKRGEALAPSPEDAEQRLELSRIQRQAKAFETGTAFRREKQQLRGVLAQQNQNAARLSGGAGGAAIAAGSRNAAAIGELLSKLGTSSRQFGLKARELASQTQANISQRKLELNLLKQSRLFAKAAQNSKSGQQNFLAGIMSIGGRGKGGTNAPTISAPTVATPTVSNVQVDPVTDPLGFGSSSAPAES